MAKNKLDLVDLVQFGWLPDLVWFGRSKQSTWVHASLFEFICAVIHSISLPFAFLAKLTSPNILYDAS